MDDILLVFLIFVVLWYAIKTQKKEKKFIF